MRSGVAVLVWWRLEKSVEPGFEIGDGRDGDGQDLLAGVFGL